MPAFLIILLFLLVLGYGLLLEFYRRHWRKIPREPEQPELPHPPIGEPPPFVTVVLVARNEEEHLPACLEGLIRQHYPSQLIEILVVDDQSTDRTAEIARSFSKKGVRLLSLEKADTGPQPFKKRALELAISQARGQWIFCTDADCFHSPEWILAMLHAQKRSGADCLCGPVRILATDRWISNFQALDFCSLQAVTGGALQSGWHAMGNGANLAFLKEAFLEVGGFSNIDRQASGDDIFLVQKFQKRGFSRVIFVKSRQAIVSTPAVESWGAFFHQRLRWASKATSYKDPRIFWSMMLVWLTNAAMMAAFLCFWIFPWGEGWALAALGLKILLELPVILEVTRFFGQQKLIRFFPLSQPLHIVYTTLVGLWSQVGSYRWKGRKMR